VNRLLCLTQYYRKRCRQCPHSRFEAVFKAKDEP
jgi:hypothetical protein